MKVRGEFIRTTRAKGFIVVRKQRDAADPGVNKLTPTGTCLDPANLEYRN